ncbi:basic leucine zipper 61-like [Dorcoceras hygrometricum]|uniref:Basic leucine zipper 61-like n=1 Tax=Dorcoceras hygrometricum TaxID=472368 RepID=A0A2Z7AW90_9LAMI|nr:basic leucine zipper 61-like [Dorcoceras hygrometricum]
MENSSHPPQNPCPLTLDEAMEYEKNHGRLFNGPNVDLTKIRRTVSSRLSARRSRIKMTNYTRDLEKKVMELEGLKSEQTTQLEIYEEKNKLLQLENDYLGKELEQRTNESSNLEIGIEENRAEIKRVKELEKTAHGNKLASDSKGKEIIDVRFEPCLKVAPYPDINLYETCLKKYLRNPIPPRVRKALDSAIQQSFPEIKPDLE